MIDVFKLEWRRLVRSKALAILIVVSLAWVFAMPYVVKGDGTAEGMREIFVRYSLGGCFALLVVTLLGVAASSLATERDSRRLQLSQVRPLGFFKLALGRVLAETLVGAIVLAVVFAAVGLRLDLSQKCHHVVSPLLPSPREEALAMYDHFMSDPETPAAVRKTKKATVLRLLERRAIDNYQTIATNTVATWKFPAKGDAVEFRFTNQMEMRQDVRGVFRSGSATLAISNITQAVLTVPFRGENEEISFENQGKSALMLRPRRDIFLLRAGDAFIWNYLRAYLCLVALIALVTGFGTLLSSALGRPVAMFVAFSFLAVSEMSPSVLEQYPDELETDRVDRIGLAMTRTVATLTRPVSALSPLEALSRNECVEASDTVRLVTMDLLLMPLVFSLIAALVIPRKAPS